MKKLLFIMLVAVSCITPCLNADSLLYAIDALDVDQVTYLLKDHKHLEPGYKKALLKAAKLSSETAKNQLSLYRSSDDRLKVEAGEALCRLGGGLGFFGFMALTFSQMINDRSGELFAVSSLTSAGALGVTGLVLMHKGLTLTGAHARLKKAREIETLIHLKPEIAATTKESTTEG